VFCLRFGAVVHRRFQVSSHSLLPDTICGGCSENVDNFYSFIKNCLQNIIILEAQYDITESCLKTKRKHDKSCLTDSAANRQEKNTQTVDYLDILLKENEEFQIDFPVLNLKKLVDYDIESDTNSESDDPHPKSSLLESLINTKNNFGRRYFDDAENYLISEIAQRKKRKNEDVIETSRPKICKLDTSNRRKNKQPRKIELTVGSVERRNFGEFAADDQTPVENDVTVLPQVCLLCDEHFTGPSMLAAHVFETHGIDMANIVAFATDPNNDKKKKLPNLLKISDLRKSESLGECHGAARLSRMGQDGADARYQPNEITSDFVVFCLKYKDSTV
jgi:hypothetical protein